MNAPLDLSNTALKISRRGESLGTENAFVVLAEVNGLVRQGRDIVSFCIGQPDFPTPANIQEAGIAAIRGGKHGYTPSAGIDELRAAAARDMGTRRGLDIAPEDVVVGAGAKPFIAYTIASVTDFGANDEVIYPVPGFPIYESPMARFRCRSISRNRAISRSIRTSSRRRSRRKPGCSFSIRRTILPAAYSSARIWR